MIVHDLSLTKADKENPEPFPITVIFTLFQVYNEPKFAQYIRMYKTAWVSSPYGWPDQINAATSYLDLSVIYGSDLYVTDLLRSHYDGELLSDSYT
ncbi:MAG: peroxidase family protein, partial [bacterium]